MIYSQFIESTSTYLKSVRILKNYVTFDMVFPHTWVLLKKAPDNIEILQNNDKDGTVVTSFVCVNNIRLIDIIETTIQKIVKTNIEREEKEKLFKNKVQELKHIFEKENLENLKAIKFDLEELTSLMTQEDDEVDTTVGEGVESAE